jgi:hypothetical protein
MDQTSVIAVIVLAGVFLVVCVCAMFRFEWVKGLLKALGFEVSIEGKRKHWDGSTGATRTNGMLDRRTGGPGGSGRAEIIVGGDLTRSSVSAKSKKEARIRIREGVKHAKLEAIGGQDAVVNVRGGMDSADAHVVAGRD